MPIKTLGSLSLSGRQASMRFSKKWNIIMNKDNKVNIKKIIILTLNDTYESRYFGYWGKKVLDIINLKKNPDTIFLKVLVGDYLFPNEYSSILNGHEMVLASNTCKFDVGCLGNHEFDFGLDILNELISMSSFPLICSNVSNILQNNSNFFNYYSFIKDNIKIGVISFVLQETSNISLGAKNITFANLDYIFNKYKYFLENQDIRILLFHDNISNIINYLNKNPAKKNLIDVICSGHEHEKYMGYINRNKFDIPIIQMGSNAYGVGYVELSFDIFSKNLKNSSLKLINIDEKNDTKLDEINVLENWISNLTDPIFSSNIGKVINYELIGISNIIRSQETNLGDLVVDSFLNAGAKLIENSNNKVFSIVNSGSIRIFQNIQIDSIINMKTIFKILPFNNLLVYIKLQGKNELNIFLNYISSKSLLKINTGGWLQISSNMLFDYKNNLFKINNIENLDDSTTFYCILPDYLANGGDTYDLLKNYKDNRVNIDMPSQNALKTYIIETLNGEISYTNNYTRIIL